MDGNLKIGSKLYTMPSISIDFLYYFYFQVVLFVLALYCTCSNKMIDSFIDHHLRTEGGDIFYVITTEWRRD